VLPRLCLSIDWTMIFGLFMNERLEFDIMELVDMLPTTDDGAAKLDFHEWQEPTACAASCAGMFLNASGVVRTPENSQKAIHEEMIPIGAVIPPVVAHRRGW